MDNSFTQSWPINGLESIEKCPVCGEADRELLHSDLVDNVFRAAPGKWSLKKCVNCRTAYLDPRPTRGTIHLAYTNYYTHQEAKEKEEYASLSLFRKLRRCMVNGYTNWRYSTCAQPSNSLGVLVAYTMPSLKRVLDRQYRHMPRLPKGGGSLLDVGCGGGSFLALARTCGWDAVGLEPDPTAAAHAAQLGLTVHVGDIEYFDGKKELFDVITLNHVIEHVDDPIKVLETCHTILKPGGQLWLETPNIESFGYARFQRNWRGLEIPRHLVLFNRQSLRQALINAGFTALHYRARPSPCSSMFQASYAMVHGHSPYQPLVAPKALEWQAVMAKYVGTLLPSRREFLTVASKKENQ